MRHYFIWLILLKSFVVSAGNKDSLTIYSCFDSAGIYFPALKDQDLLKTVNALKLKNISSNWLPQFSLNGQANYNSDVTSVNVDLPFPGISFPSSPHDQYKIAVDVNQTIWDGGLSKEQKQLENASLEADLQQLRTDLYALKERISKLYFYCLVLQENEKLTLALQTYLEQKLNLLQSALKNGTVSVNHVLSLEAELLKVKQKLFEIQSDLYSSFQILSILTGIKHPENFQLVVPYVQELKNFDLGNRPEIALFGVQQKKLDASGQMVKIKTRPRAFVFGQFGYGNPGLNMLGSTWDTYYVIGAGLKWNFWDWNTSQREQKILSFQREMVDNRREVFENNLSVQLQNEISSIKKYTRLLENDQKQLEIRKKILSVTESQFQNGVISANEYLSELNALNQAEISLSSNAILLAQARMNLSILVGK